MLLKFTTTDMLNTALINVATGQLEYEIITAPVAEKIQEAPVLSCLPSPGVTTTSESASFSPVKEYSSHPVEDENLDHRRTQILGTLGCVMAEIFWKGCHPTIYIEGEKVGNLKNLFGTSTVPFMPKVLAIPTKFDPDYVWTGTAESLTLVDYNTEDVKGTFHQSVLRFPVPMKRARTKSASPTAPEYLQPVSNQNKSFLKSSSRIFSLSKSCIIDDSQDLSAKFIPTHVPGFGSNYLEFSPHPLAKDVEIILSFLIMEILRRGRFSLTPYTFDNPTIWQFKEARDIVMRRIRRKTI